jgi:hypothetical protein
MPPTDASSVESLEQPARTKEAAPSRAIPVNAIFMKYLSECPSPKILETLFRVSLTYQFSQ